MKIVFSFWFLVFPVSSHYTILFAFQGSFLAASGKLWLSFGGASLACFVVSAGTHDSLYENIF